MRKQICSGLVLWIAVTSLSPGGEPIAIGDRRELLVDDHLIESMTGSVELRLHRPVPREIVMVHDEPWEGSGCGYHSIFHDGEKYRMSYKAWQLTVGEKGLEPAGNHFTCYAESDDGITWRKPKLGLFSFQGSKENNIVVAPDGPWGETKPDGTHPAVFHDENPDCPADERYKAIVRSRGPKGLLVLKSGDGTRFTPMFDEPVITDGAFDSQNLAFWDSVRKEYRAYWRIFTEKRREIRTATSSNLKDWSPHRDLQYTEAPPEQLYVNQIKPYHRAPHLFVGFPVRYIDRGWSSPSMEALPDPEHRKRRSAVSRRYGTALTEGLFMTSRDGVTFHRWPEAFLRPGPERDGQWKYGDNYIGWHVVETKGSLPGAANELSIYASEGYWTGKENQLRRYTLRLDGFVSAQARLSGGTVLTKPILFSGDRLELNFSSSAAGDIRVAIKKADGVAIPGFTLEDCHPVFGDAIERTVHWKSGAAVSRFAGEPVRLQFFLRDADLFAFRFVEGE